MPPTNTPRNGSPEQAHPRSARRASASTRNFMSAVPVYMHDPEPMVLDTDMDPAARTTEDIDFDEDDEHDAYHENLRFLRSPIDTISPIRPRGTIAQQVSSARGPRIEHAALLGAEDPSAESGVDIQTRRELLQRDRMMRVLSRVHRLDEQGMRTSGGRHEERAGTHIQAEQGRLGTTGDHSAAARQGSRAAQAQAEGAQRVTLHATREDRVRARGASSDELADLGDVIQRLRRENPYAAPELIRQRAEAEVPYPRVAREVLARRQVDGHENGGRGYGLDGADTLTSMQRLERAETRDMRTEAREGGEWTRAGTAHNITLIMDEGRHASGTPALSADPTPAEARLGMPRDVAEALGDGPWTVVETTPNVYPRGTQDDRVRARTETTPLSSILDGGRRAFGTPAPIADPTPAEASSGMPHGVAEALGDGTWTAFETTPNAYATERMLRYIRQREQLGSDEQPETGPTHDSGRAWRWPTSSSRSVGFTSQARSDTHSNVEAADTYASVARSAQTLVQQNLERYRRDFLTPHPSHRHHQSKSSAAKVTPFLENAVKYLDRLRSSMSYDDSLTAAIELGFANKEFFADKHDDFIMDITQQPAPCASSFLKPGASFTGSQYTSFESGGLPDDSNTAGRQGTANIDATRPLHAQVNAIAAISGTLSPEARARAMAQTDEHWPVKVNLHAVDFDSMTLAGTMEAYNVPVRGKLRDLSIPNSARMQEPPITTFFEGQIIDLQAHTFLTPPGTIKSPAAHSSAAGDASTLSAQSIKINFPSTTASIDAANWRRLPPFRTISDDEVARILLSQDRMAALNSEYIFMRWKERCFIHDRGDCECPQSPSRHRAHLRATQRAHGNYSSGAQGRTQGGVRAGTASHEPRRRRNAPTSSARDASGTLGAGLLPDAPATAPGPGPSIIAHIPRQPSHTPTQTSTSTARARQSSSSSMRSTHRTTRSTSAEHAGGAADELSLPTTTAHVPTQGEGDDTDTSHGLTIGGFYYVSLARQTGDLVGLYHDPGTNPFQCLRLKGERGGGVGGWAFT